MRIATLVLSVSTAVSQTAPPTPARFHLPAGDHPIVQVLQLAEQAVKKPIGTREVDDLAAKPPLRLQVDLQLTGDDFEDVLGALLSTRELVLARSEDAKGYEVLPMPRGDARWLRDRAVVLSVADLHRRAAHTGPVRVVASTAVDAAMVSAMLRPHLAVSRRSLSVEAVDGGIALTGLADVVRFGLSQVAVADPEFARQLATPAAAPWPRPVRAQQHELPAGRYTALDLADRLAKALGRQHVASAALAAERPGDATIEVKEAVRGDDVQFEDRVTALLWRERLLLVPLALPGIYEVARVGEDGRVPNERAEFVSAAEVAARPERVALVTLEIALAGRAPGEVMTAARTVLQGPARSSTTMSMLQDKVLVTGLNHHLAAVLPALLPPK